MMKKPLPLLLLPLLSLASPAAVSPLQIGFNSPFHTGPGGDELQLVSPETTILGLRLNLPVTFNHNVGGLDVGLFSYATHFSGIRLNFQSWTHKTVRGVDVSLIGMGTEDEESALYGIQIAGMGLVRHMRGIQAGLLTHGDVRGVQMGLWNIATDLRGLQMGLVNFIVNPEAPAAGVQIGLVNFAEIPPHGLQIGLLNIAPSSVCPYLPLLRLSF